MRLLIISEAGYGRTYSFPYQRAQHDPRPRLLLLGKWRHPSTRNILLAGINLNYVDENQLAELRKSLKAILQTRNLKARYWKGMELLPDIFKNAYRTYDKDYVGSITKDTLKFWPSEAALDSYEKEAQDAEAKAKEKELKTTQPGVEPAPGAPVAPAPEASLEAPPITPEVEPGGPPDTPPEPEGGVPAPKPPKGPAPKGTPRQRRAQKAPAEPVEPTAKPAAEPTVPVEPPEKKPMTSAQRRKKQAEQIKNAIERTKPEPKPEAPPEIGPALNMFKGKKKPK